LPLLLRKLLLLLLALPLPRSKLWGRLLPGPLLLLLLLPLSLLLSVRVEVAPEGGLEIREVEVDELFDSKLEHVGGDGEQLAVGVLLQVLWQLRELGHELLGSRLRQLAQEYLDLVRLPGRRGRRGVGVGTERSKAFPLELLLLLQSQLLVLGEDEVLVAAELGAVQVGE